MNMLPVYFDLDGVLFDFDRAYDERVGVRKPNGDVHWDAIAALDDFFESMPLMPGALELWNLVPAERRRILSSIPKSVSVSGEQKRAAVHRHFEISDDRVVLVRGKRLKKLYALPGHALVDDWPDNVGDWNEAGGVGILYQNHAQAMLDLASIL